MNILLDQLLQELNEEGDEFIRMCLRDSESTDINIPTEDEELFDEMVRRILVNLED